MCSSAWLRGNLSLESSTDPPWTFLSWAGLLDLANLSMCSSSKFLANLNICSSFWFLALKWDCWLLGELLAYLSKWSSTCFFAKRNKWSSAWFLVNLNARSPAGLFLANRNMWSFAKFLENRSNGLLEYLQVFILKQFKYLGILDNLIFFLTYLM